MLKKFLVIVAMGTVAASAFAGHAAQATAEKVIELKDGSTVYLFKDGKMAMETKFGRATRMKEGEVMDTKDGQQIKMRGDEVMRLDLLLKDGHEAS